jgi:beta-glucosidase
MTLDEKIGQMNQYNGDWKQPVQYTRTVTNKTRYEKDAWFNAECDWRRTYKQLQEIAMESRLKIPLLFGQDIIHGYRTIFPIPLAEASSWDTSSSNYRQGSLPRKQLRPVYIGHLRRWLISLVIHDGEE